MSEDPQESNGIKKRNRKKRKNFLANAKKYVKKGQMGRGTKVPEELYQYFVGILDAIKLGIKDPDERLALVNNVLERTKGEELNVVGNQLGSRLIELLLPYSSPEDLERFIEVLSPELRRLCSDNFTSHIIETLLRVSCERAIAHLQEDTDDTEEPKNKKKKTSNKYSEQHIANCHEFTLKICKYALNNLEDFVWDSYANHILRSAMKCLSGITLLPGEKPKLNLLKETVQDNKGIPPHLTSLNYKNVPDDFKEIIKEFANRLSMWPQFKDLPYQNVTSALLQVLLYAVKNVDKKLTNNLITKLLNESFAPEDWVASGQDGKEDDKKNVDLTAGDDENGGDADDGRANLPPVFESESAVRLLEAALFVAKKKKYTQLYARCFINRLGQLARLPMLNFTVQRLLDNCRLKEEFEPMFDELSGQFGALLRCGNSGVLVALAKGCVRLRARQAQYVQRLEEALECTAADQQRYFPVLCLRLQPLRAVDVATLSQEYFIHVHGSVMLQSILEFQRPAKAVSGLLAMSAEELAVVLRDAKGCHVADALCRSPRVGGKARDKLLGLLAGYYQKLVLSQYGSRAFEAIFSAASHEQKVRIMTELADKSSLLNSTQYGRLVATKLDVATFKTAQRQWEQTRMKLDKEELVEGRDK